MADSMQIEILADGTMKVTTDKVSMANHMSAEKFMKGVAEMLGGTVTKLKRKGRTSHTHSHDHGHSHG